MYSLAHGNILEYFYTKTGIHFDEKKDVVAHKINSFYKARNFHDTESFFAALKKDDSLWQEFVNLLTVNETYFFRETKQVDMLISMAKELRSFDILCAPSSSGEEPYTILMSLAEAGLLGRVNKLVGIDINSDVIEKAKKGVYSKRSLHRTPANVVSKYFIENHEHNFEIVNEIKKYVDFKVFNIFDSSVKSLGQFDFVFSRNMIIYFDKESRHEAEKALFGFMKESGILFLGHADIVQNSFNLKKTVVEGIVYYKKE
jgi:chemotaxis protein methyltransferase CheR